MNTEFFYLEKNKEGKQCLGFSKYCKKLFEMYKSGNIELSSEHVKKRLSMKDIFKINNFEFPAIEEIHCTLCKKNIKFEKEQLIYDHIIADLDIQIEQKKELEYQKKQYQIEKEKLKAERQRKIEEEKKRKIENEIELERKKAEIDKKNEEDKKRKIENEILIANQINKRNKINQIDEYHSYIIKQITELSQMKSNIQIENDLLNKKYQEIEKEEEKLKLFKSELENKIDIEEIEKEKKSMENDFVFEKEIYNNDNNNNNNLNLNSNSNSNLSKQDFSDITELKKAHDSKLIDYSAVKNIIVKQVNNCFDKLGENSEFLCINCKCNIIKNQRRDLVEHLLKCYNFVYETCPFCNRTYNTPKQFSRHLEASHKI
jgi:hypothetical protein